MAFVAGAGVTVTDISREHAVDIFTGKITNWRELGGRSATIRAIGREVTDASRQAIMREIKAFENLRYADSVKIVLLDTQLVELLDRYPASFAFLNRSGLGAAETRLVAMSLDSVEPTAENVRTGRYPLWTELGLIYRKSALTEAGRAFLEFVDSPRGAEILHTHGILPAEPGSKNR